MIRKIQGSNIEKVAEIWLSTNVKTATISPLDIGKVNLIGAVERYNQ